MTTTTEDFELAFRLLIDHEGGFTDNRADPGNWTGGSVGSGRLVGTKFGISAASHPDLDIRNLTLDQARDIYRADFWDRIGADVMPPRLAFVVFDAAVNNGAARAARWLQEAVGAAADGIVGPQTRAAIATAVARDPLDLELASEVHARRLHFMAGLSTWPTFGLGWSRRLASVPLEAAHHWPGGRDVG
jgi:lysozyme family protein